jgi:hypothetical protein
MANDKAQMTKEIKWPMRKCAAGEGKAVGVYRFLHRGTGEAPVLRDSVLVDSPVRFN